MQSPKINETRNWIKKADQDLYSAAWLLQSPDPVYNAVGFHCQQAAEKALKAYLTWIEQPFEKTHSLVALVGICLLFEQQFETLRKASTVLTPYAITTRYPGDLPELSCQEANEALTLAQQIFDFVLERIPPDTQV